MADSIENKDLAYVCHYLKSLVIPKMSDNFVVAESFRYGFTDDEIRKGITAFREFLYALFDRLANGKDKIDLTTGSNYNPKYEVGYGDKYRIKACFPSIWDLTMILCSMGIRGEVKKSPEIKLTVNCTDLLTVICPITEKDVSLIKMNDERKLEMFHLLSDLGLRFHGADFSEEVGFSKIEKFDVTSESNDYFPLGLKLISEATAHHKHHYKLENMFYPVFLRCSYYPLENDKPRKHVVKVKDFVNSRPSEIKKWIIDIDTFLTKNGCTVSHNIGGCDIEFTYNRKKVKSRKGMVCKIYMDIWGSYIYPGINHLEKPDSIINDLPNEMIAILVAKSERECGWCKHSRENPDLIQCRPGCPFKFTYNGIEYVKCRYVEFKLPIEDASTRQLTQKWIEKELAI